MWAKKIRFVSLFLQCERSLNYFVDDFHLIVAYKSVAERNFNLSLLHSSYTSFSPLTCEEYVDSIISAVIKCYTSSVTHITSFSLSFCLSLFPLSRCISNTGLCILSAHTHTQTLTLVPTEQLVPTWMQFPEKSPPPSYKNLSTHTLIGFSIHVGTYY